MVFFLVLYRSFRFNICKRQLNNGTTEQPSKTDISQRFFNRKIYSSLCDNPICATQQCMVHSIKMSDWQKSYARQDRKWKWFTVRYKMTATFLYITICEKCETMDEWNSCNSRIDVAEHFFIFIFFSPFAFCKLTILQLKSIFHRVDWILFCGCVEFCLLFHIFRCILYTNRPIIHSFVSVFITLLFVVPNCKTAAFNRIFLMTFSWKNLAISSAIGLSLAVIYRKSENDS